MYFSDWWFMFTTLWLHVLAIPFAQWFLDLRSAPAVFALHWIGQIVFHRNLNKILAHSLKAKYGLLAEEKPRSRVSTKARVYTKLFGLLGAAWRVSALFVSAYKGPEPFRLEKLWLPKYVLYTIILDFIFYWAHRSQHKSKFLFKHVHSKHHSMQLPNVFSTVHDTVFEKFFNTFVMMLVVNSLVPMGFWSLHACYYGIHLVECLGHSGIKAHLTNPNMPFMTLFNIDLSVEDHDLHHRKFQGNFSKQLRLWDQVFGTELPRIET